MNVRDIFKWQAAENVFCEKLIERVIRCLRCFQFPIYVGLVKGWGSPAKQLQHPEARLGGSFGKERIVNGCVRTAFISSEQKIAVRGREHTCQQLLNQIRDTEA